MVGVPPNHAEDRLIANAPNSFGAAEAKRYEFVNIVEFEFRKTPLCFSGKILNCNCVILRAVENLLPCSCFKATQLFNNDAHAVCSDRGGTKRATQIEMAQVPRNTLIVEAFRIVCKPGRLPGWWVNDVAGSLSLGAHSPSGGSEL